MSFLDIEVESSNNGSWKASTGKHNAVVVGLVNHGKNERTSKKNVPYTVNQGELIFAIEDVNPNNNHITIGSYKMDFTLNDTKFKLWCDNAKWCDTSKSFKYGILMKKTCIIEVEEAVSKAGNKYNKITSVTEGPGFKATGKCEVSAFITDDNAIDDIYLINGAFIAEKRAATVATPMDPAQAEEIKKNATAYQAKQAEANAAASAASEDDSLPF